MFYKPFFRSLARPKVDAYIRSEEPSIVLEDYDIKDIEVPEEKVVAEYEDFPVKPTVEEDSSDSYLRFKEAYNKVGTPKMFNFFSLLAKKESGYNSEIQNLQGAPAYGYFQFMQDGKRWNNIMDYAGVDIDTFRRSPEIQIKAAHKLANAFLSGFSDKDRARARELGYTDSALLAGAWLGGVGGVRKFLHEGKNVDDKHWSKNKNVGVDMKSRMDEFNNMFQDGGKIVKDIYKARNESLKDNIKSYYKGWVPFVGNLGYNTLAMNIDTSDADTINEAVKASKPYYQMKAIDDLKYIFENTLYDNELVVPNKELDSSKEIYPKAVSFRYWAYKNLGYDLNHKWTSEDIDNIKKAALKSIDAYGLNGPIDEYSPDLEFVKRRSGDGPSGQYFRTVNNYKYDDGFITRFSTNFILRVLNDVADANNKYIPVAKGGMVFKNSYNDPDEYYDYSMGSRDGDDSRNPDTGLELKHPNHPTAWMGHEYDESHGYKRYVDKYTGRYYTFKDNVEKNMKGLLLNLEEVGYPQYGEGRNSMEESIDSNFDRIKWIYNEMVNRGLSKEQAAAILGNMWKESRVSYKADNNGAYGLVQLTGQRKDAYKEYLDKYSLDDNTINQVNYLIPLIISDDDNPHNLSNAYTYSGGALDSYNRDWMEWSKDNRTNFLKSKDLRKLSDMFCDYFEKPKENEADKETRYAAAKYIYNKINNGK